MTTVLILISVFLALGIIYTIYSISVAKVDEGEMEENFDEKNFEKPPGWKVGKMPKDLSKPIKVTKKKATDSKKPESLRVWISKLEWENSSKTKNSNTA